MEKAETQSPQESRKKGSSKFKWVAISLVFIVLLFVAYYYIMTAKAAKNWAADFDAKYTETIKQSDSAVMRLFTDSTFRALQKKIAFTKAKLELTKADPIGLSIDLTDSISRLEVNGVTVHSSQIKEIDICQSLYGVEPYFLSLELSKPLKIASEVATIPKEPILVKTAPKDTIEAAKAASVPDTATTGPVYFEMTFENGFRLLVLQESDNKSFINRDLMKFLYSIRAARVRNNLKSILKFKVPSYSPEIVLVVPGWEAKTIYRAVPENGLVALRIY